MHAEDQKRALITFSSDPAGREIVPCTDKTDISGRDTRRDIG
jgi:hypothetical protein